MINQTQKTVKPINRNKLPIKYIVRTYTLLKEYPSPLDILYDLASDIEIINGLEFDYNYAKYILSGKLSKQKYNDILKILVKEGFLEEKTLGKLKLHKLINHPWE